MIDFFDYFFIYLTNWGYIVLTAYLTWSAVSVTIRYVQQCSPACQKKESKEQFKNDNVKVSNCCIVGCCCPQNSLQWYEFIHWLLFVLGIEPAVTITMLYWPSFLVYDAATSSPSYYSLMYHLINGLVALMDMWITRIPIRLYHVIYPVIFVSAYSLFTGLYYVGGGLDPLNNTYIYSVLDYENDPGVAAGITVGASLVIVPLFHLFLYCNYILREGLLYIVKKYSCKCLEDNEIHVADISTEDNELA
jgi:hypothetical protein